MSVEQWMALIQTFGLATVLLMFGGFAGWKILGWVGREIVIPVRDKVISNLADFLTTAKEALPRMEAAVERLENALGRFECKADKLQQQQTQLHHQQQIFPTTPSQPPK